EGRGGGGALGRRGWLERGRARVEANFAPLAEAAGESVPAALLEPVRSAARAAAVERAARFEARREAGRAVDGHGDLHLAHVWFEADRAAPIFVDCLEFDTGLRRIDAAADVAFLAMD